MDEEMGMYVYMDIHTEQQVYIVCDSGGWRMEDRGWSKKELGCLLAFGGYRQVKSTWIGR